MESTINSRLIYTTNPIESFKQPIEEGNEDEEGLSERYIRAEDIVSCDDEESKEMGEKQD